MNFLKDKMNWQKQSKTIVVAKVTLKLYICCTSKEQLNARKGKNLVKLKKFTL